MDNGRALLRLASELKPDVVILDIGMPQLNGLDAGDQIKQLLPTTKLVFLTMNLSPEVAAEAFRRGASGYVVKSSAAAELVRAIRRALRSESYLSPDITKETVDFLLRSGNSYSEEKRITPRQREVLQLLAEGMSMKEIAARVELEAGHRGLPQIQNDGDTWVSSPMPNCFSMQSGTTLERNTLAEARLLSPHLSFCPKRPLYVTGRHPCI